MQDKFYFTRFREAVYASELIEAMEEALDSGEYSNDPKDLDSGTLYRVTIERVGVVRIAKEIEMDGEGN